MPDEFISYSRRDDLFVQRLHNDLLAQGHDVWLDREDIPLTADWWQEIKRGIESANAVIVVLTLHSTRSLVCVLEMHYAASLNKRLVPVVAEVFDSDAMRKELLSQPLNPAASSILEGRDLAAMVDEAWQAITFPNWISFAKNDDYEKTFQALVEVLGMDLDHTHEHTRLLMRSREWEQNHRTPGYMLAGEDLAVAEDWLTQAQARAKQPTPTAMQVIYIRESRQAEDDLNRRLKNLRRARVGLSALAVTALTIGGLTALQVRRARKQIEDMNVELTEVGAEVDRQSNRVRALDLAVGADTLFRKGRSLEALDTILEASELDQDSPEVHSTLSDIALHPGLPLALLSTDRRIQDLVLTPDADAVYFTHHDGGLYLWDWRGHTSDAVKLVGLEALTPLLQRDLQFPDRFGIAYLDIANNGESLVFSTSEGDVFIHDVATKQTELLRSPEESFWSTHVAISGDGRFIAAGFDDDDLYIWERLDGRWTESFVSSIKTGRGYNGVALSDDGSILAISGNTARFVWHWAWQHRDPDQLDIGAIVWGVDISADGKRSAAGADDNNIHLWDPGKNHQPHRRLTGHRDTVVSVALPADGSYIASGSIDEIAYIWDGDVRSTHPSPPMYELTGAQNWVSALDVSRDSRLIAVGSFDGTIRVVRSRPPNITKAYRASSLPSLSADKSLVLVSGEDGEYHEVIRWTTATRMRLEVPFETRHIIADEAHEILVVADSFNLMFLSGFGDAPFSLDTFGTWWDVHKIDRDYAPIPTSLALSPDHQRLVLGMDQDVFFWFADEPDVLRHVPELTGATGIVFNAEGTKLYMKRGTLMVHDFATGEPSPLLETEFLINDFAVNDSEDRVVMAGIDRVVHVYDLSKRELLQSLRGHLGAVAHVDITADGKRAISGGEDTDVLIWDLEKGARLQSLTGHFNLNDLAISDDGARAITIGSGVVREWQIFETVPDIVTYLESIHLIER